MFEFLEGHSEFSNSGGTSDENLALAKEKLNGVATDLIAFIEKFGHADIGDGYLTVYDWVEDLAYYVTIMGAEKPDVNAWVFGDRDGDLFAIDKETGEIIEFDHESSTVSSLRYELFSAFIKKTIADA